MHNNSEAQLLRKYGNMSKRENLVMTSLYVRTSVRSFRLALSRYESPPPQLDSFVPIVSKGFKHHWPIRICLVSICLVVFRGKGNMQFDTFVGKVTNIFNKMTGVLLPCGGFQDQTFAFQVWKYTVKRPQWRGKGKKNTQFPFCGQTKAFRYEIVLRGIPPCLLHGEVLGLFWTKRTKEPKILKKFKQGCWLFQKNPFVSIKQPNLTV